jgi:hypothetical protein
VVYQAVTMHVFALFVICDGLYWEFYFKLHVYVYSVSAYLMLLTVLLVGRFIFGSMCGCPEFFLLERKLVVWRSAIMVICGRCFREVSCVDTWAVGRVVCCYLVFVSCSALNTGLCESFICKVSLLILYMWHFSVMYKCFLCVLISPRRLHKKSRTTL